MGIGVGFSRAVAAVTTVISLAVGGVASTRHSGVPARHRAESTAASIANIDLYRGLGSWVDIYERRSWANPERAIAGMHRRGALPLLRVDA